MLYRCDLIPDAEISSMSHEMHSDELTPHTAADERDAQATSLLQQLDARQDKVMEDLDDLNGQIEDLIDFWRTKKTDDCPETPEDESPTADQVDAA